jgi:hypothetical protein
LAFPAAPSCAISANACGGKGVDKLSLEMVTYEYYRPPYPVYLAILNAATRAHLEGGGLLLRPAIGERYSDTHDGLTLGEVRKSGGLQRLTKKL